MTPDPALVAALTQSVLPSGLSVVARDPRVVPDDTDPVESAALRGAIPRRLVEFQAGRAAARAAMIGLGATPRTVLMGPDRAPVWPKGLTGSISHTASACVAVVGVRRQWAGIGVDLEGATPLEPLLVGEVCTKSEQRWLGQQPQAERGLMSKLVFSAKEAAYKAQYTLSGQLFGFEALELQVDRAHSTFEARFVIAQGPFEAGAILQGRYAHAAGLIVTAVVIAQTGASGNKGKIEEPPRW